MREMSMTKQIRDMDFTFQLIKTMDTPGGNRVDMYYNEENRISIGVPHGSTTLLHFIVRSLTSGAKVLRTFNIDNERVEKDFAP